LQAAQQGGITQVTVDGITYGSYQSGVDMEAQKPNWNLMWIAISVFVAGLSILTGAVVWSRTRCRSTNNPSLKMPLMVDEDKE
jgi:hypothetical protein